MNTDTYHLWILAIVLCSSAALLGVLRITQPETTFDASEVDTWLVLQDTMSSKVKPTDNNFKLCMLVRTYAKHMATLPTFLLSAAASGLSVDNFRVFFVVTDPDYKGVSNKVALLATAASILVVLPVPFRQAVEPDYGYAQTDAALHDHFYNTSSQTNAQPHTCDYLIVTNGDNYYARNFGGDLMQLAPKDLIMFDWVTHHKLKTCSFTPKVWTDCQGQPLQAEPKVLHIDLGAAMWRLKFLKDNQIYYAAADGKWTDLADGHMVEKSTKVPGCLWRTLRKTLLMHQ